MIFPTLEGLTADQQEAHEAQQRAAFGRFGSTVRSSCNVSVRGRVARRVLAFMQAGREYAASQVAAGGRVSSYQVGQLADVGVLTRSGERGRYRYTKSEAFA